MENMTERKFSDYLIEKRFKKLERALKIATLKKGYMQEDESWSLVVSPSISSINSINADAFDSSINVPSLQASKIGSEVVSSSKNLRNIVLNKKDIKNNMPSISTSTVKKFNTMNDSKKDYFMMPPPNFNSGSCTFKRLNNTSVSNTTTVTSTFENKCNLSTVDKQSPKRNILGSLQINSNEIIQNTKVRVFSQWKVALNEQGQLIIQGIINCRQIARSKPILRRLTSTEVQSVFKHIYRLNGNIVDNENELPNYVRGKFYNGFPDDWENVHQVWRTFVQEGFKLTFRWPTPLADSDDDLRSEVTDVTYTESMHISQVDSVLETNRNKQYFNLPTRELCNSFTQTCTSDINEDIQQNCNEEDQKQLTNIATKCSYNDNKTNRLRDKLNVIVNNLTDGNCPQEFISKIVEIFDCLNYVVSYGSVKDNESNMEISTSIQNKSIIQERKNDISNKSFSSYDVISCNKNKCNNTTVHQNQKYHENMKHIITNNKSTACNYLLSKPKTSTKMNRREDKNTSDSESEIYAGVPKISAQRILQQKETLVKPYKRKSRTKLSRQKYDIQEKEHTSNLSTVNSKNVDCMYVYDSSVSIIGDKVDFSNNENIVNSDVKDDINKNVTAAKPARRQREESSVFVKKSNAREIQKHSSREDITRTCPVENHSDSFSINESNVCKINKTLENKNEITKIYIPNGTLEKQNYNVNNQYQQEDCSKEQLEEFSSYRFKDVTNNISKPVVISSMPVNINTTHTSVKQIKDASKNITKSEKEEYLVKEKSPLKTLNAFRDIASVSLISDNENELEESNKLLHTQEDYVCDDKPNKDDIKYDSLDHWTPKVICDPKLCLIFEGRLINDAGHIVDRKYQTDAVLRRVSLKLIETISNKFYQLVGDLNDIKHVIPKPLVNLCRYGCPTRIEQFCKDWKSLQNSAHNSSQLDRSMNIRISSKGRRIVPALNYWTGERFVLKNNNPVYTPGSLQDSLSSIDESPRRNKHVKETKKGENNSKKKRNLEELKNSSANSVDKSINSKSIENTKKIENITHKEIGRKKKKRIAVERLDSSYSSDSKESPVNKKQRIDSNLQECLNSTHTTKKFDEKVVINRENPRKYHLEDEETKLTSKSTKLKTKTNAKPSMPQVNNKQMSTDKYMLSTENCYKEECLYYKSFRLMDETLSEDLESHV